MILEKPDKKFWSNGNLFLAFKACLMRLYNAVLHTDLYDTFDNRLKLLSLVPDSPRDGPYDGELQKKNEEEKAKIGETCRKYLQLKHYIAMTGILKEVTTGLQISEMKGPKSVIEFFQTRVFRIKQFSKHWSKVEMSILDLATKDLNTEDKSKIELQSVIGTGKSYSLNSIFESTLLVATPEFRKSWNAESEWTKYTDEKEEYNIFMQNIVLKDFQSEMIAFRSYLFKEDVDPTKCKWCGINYTNTEHIFLGCTKVKEFWKEYCLKPGKWNIVYELDDIDGFVHDLLHPQNLDLCSHSENQSINTKQHKIRMLNMTKEYLLVCQKVGILPSQQEIDCQFKAMQYRKTDHNFGRYWFKCPLPPPRGISSLNTIDYNQDQY